MGKRVFIGEVPSLGNKMKISLPFIHSGCYIACIKSDKGVLASSIFIKKLEKSMAGFNPACNYFEKCLNIYLL